MSLPATAARHLLVLLGLLLLWFALTLGTPSAEQAKILILMCVGLAYLLARTGTHPPPTE